MAMTSDQLIALRATIPDDAPVFGPERNQYIFTDEQLGAFFVTTGRESILRTAAVVCRAAGNSDLARIGEFRDDELNPQASRTAAEWRQAASQLWTWADEEDAALNDGGEFFGIYNPFLTHQHAEGTPWPIRGLPWG